MKQERSLKNALGTLLVIIGAPIVLLTLLLEKLRNPRRPRLKQPIAHIVRGQFMLLVTHAANASREEIVKAIRSITLYDRLPQPVIRDDRIATFQAADAGPAFSLVPVEVQTGRDEQRVFDLIRQINIELGGEDWACSPRTSPYETRRRAAAGNGAQVQLATPNWLVGSAVERNGSGSPGARPVPPDPTTIDDESWLAAVPLLQVTPAQNNAYGRNIDVFILDTAPDATDLARARERWPQHRLLPSLLKMLTVEYAGGTHLLQDADYYHENANYVMSDHGLFVASIVHRIVPEARLHLVEVLNPYGVGTLLSIAHGFAHVTHHLAHKPGAKIIINASLGFEVAPPDDAWLAYMREQDDFWNTLSPDEIRALMQPLERICEVFAYHQPRRQAPAPDARCNRGVVAAAGNDAVQAPMLPPARYPAAFDGVQGVGALLSDHQTRADYSNQADTPETSGIYVFGGDRAGLNADSVRGMPGVYIGAFPDGESNQAGWARWAGTSFATPIVTGTIAALMSQGQSFCDARDAVYSALKQPQ